MNGNTVLVLDTNWALDLLVFDDPRAQAVRQGLEQRRLRWLVCVGMREELARVLTYPLVARRLQRIRRETAEVLDRFDQWTQSVALPPAAPWRCSDPDDQIFIDLACHHRALLLSKDRAVLQVGRCLRESGAGVQSDWIPT